MAEKEREKINEILTTLDADEFLVRSNSGTAWAGEVLDRKPGIIVLGNPRPFHGMPKGWPDLVGWRTVDISGTRIAQFYAVEVKTGKGRMTADQER